MQREAIVVKSSVNQLQHASAVMFYWQIEVNENQEISQTILPTIYQDLIFPLQGGLKIEGYSSFVNFAFAGPLLKKGLKINFSGESRIFGFRLNPLFVNRFFRISPAEFIQGPNELNKVLYPNLYRCLMNLVKDAPFETLANKLNNFFSQNSLAGHDEKMITYALEQIRDNPEVNIAELSQSNQCSTKWLQVQFQRYLGAKPYEFVKLSRFNRFLSLLNHHADKSLTTLALQAGYYDQSHLIKEFKNFNANTPRQFRQNFTDFYRIMNHL